MYTDARNYPFCHTTLILRRKPWNVVWNKFLLISFLSSCGMAGFSIVNREDRMAYLIALFFPIVVTQIETSNTSPKSARPSFADFVMLSGTAFTAALIIETGVDSNA